MTKDPAIEQWAGPSPLSPLWFLTNEPEWRNQQHRAFKWTPRTTFWSIFMGLVIPSSLVYLAYYTGVHIPPFQSFADPDDIVWIY